MRVFKFLSARHALDGIRRRRLKIATLSELNDPFELFGIDLRDEQLRRVLRRVKDRATKQMGLLCFSRDWHNPVLWSHYAERHTGMCLGFDIADDRLHAISYSRRRAVIPAEYLRSQERDMTEIMKCLFTKYSHWKYEAEARVFINLSETDLEESLHFVDFADTLHLQTVIVGTQSLVTRRELAGVLGELASTVKVFKGHLAFGTFRVVRQKREELWR